MTTSPALLLLSCLLLACPKDDTGTSDVPDDIDGDGYFVTDDCDDADPAIHPGATETCNDRDDDCDGTTDEGTQATFYADVDGDGYGDLAASIASCAPPTGYVDDATDCDDADATHNPGAVETCNDEDDDCDGAIDEDLATSTSWADADGDGYGDPAAASTDCVALPGHVDNDDDCDDADAAVNPGATETRNDKDDDCDSVIDEGTLPGFSVEGTAVDLLDGTPAAEGLCVQVADPTPAIAGGDLIVLATSTVGADGAYRVDGIVTTSVIGLLVLVQDCAGPDAVMPTGTGILVSDYAGLGTGDTLSGVTAWSVDGSTAADMNGMLHDAGYGGELSKDGALMGFVLDETGAPVDGATIMGSSSYTTWYYTGEGFNTTGTVAEAGALYAIPSAPIYSYTCRAPGETYDTILAGSYPGMVVVVWFQAI